VWVVVGATLGMVLANLPAVCLGGARVQRLSMPLVYSAAALIFLALGVLTLFNMGRLFQCRVGHCGPKRKLRWARWLRIGRSLGCSGGGAGGLNHSFGPRRQAAHHRPCISGKPTPALAQQQRAPS
jgi:hypothetical protein